MTIIHLTKSETFELHLEDGNVEGLKENLEPELVEEIIDPNLELKPIHLACQKGYLEIVKLLIENKCDIESEDKKGWRPIHYACENGHMEIVKLLIEKKCKIESDTKDRRRPIHVACENGNFEIVKLLIDSKCEIECKDLGGWRLIHYVCQKGHTEIVKLLIEKNCDIERNEKLGLRSIHLACENGHLEIVKLLIKNKCNIESENNWGRRPIHLACQNGHLEIVKLLIEYKGNIECETFEGWRPIHLACYYGHLEIVRLLMENKGTIESVTKDKRKPIHLACEGGNFEIVKLLIAKKCKIESKDLRRWRPIYYACWNGNYEIVKHLVGKNCLINVTDKDEKTPLEIAKAKGHNKIVKLLSELDKVTKQVEGFILNNDDGDFSKFYKSDLLTGRSWLKMSLDQKADKIIKYFLDRPIDITEIVYIKTITNSRPPESPNSELWEEILLYKFIKHHHEADFQSICRPNIINRPTKIIPCSFLELAAEEGNFIFFKEIIKKTLYNSKTWEKAKEITLRKGYNDKHNSLSNREVLFKNREKNNVSILHTAVCDNDPEMLEYILSEGLVDLNHNHEVLGTAFAFAVLLYHHECLSIFERFNIDFNTHNKYLQSPLSEAINNGMIEHCQYLINRIENIDQPGFMGQTALHCAVIRGCEELCDQLIEKGADCLRYMEFCQPFTEKKGSPISKESFQLSQRENSLTLCLKMNRTIYPCFLKSLERNKANSTNNVEENGLDLSLYHLAALDDKDTFECLLSIEIKNPLRFRNGETLLTKLLKERKFDFCRQIMESKKNNKKFINLKNMNNQTPLQVSIETESMDIVQSLIFETVSIDNEDSEGNTALMQLFAKISNKDNKNFNILNAIKAIICKGGNIYKRTSKFRKPIDYCSLASVREEIATFYNEQIKSTNNICLICLDKGVDSVFECGHTICKICCIDIEKCPFCGLEDIRSKRVYFK